jgi:hypothetical protein
VSSWRIAAPTSVYSYAGRFVAEQSSTHEGEAALFSRRTHGVVAGLYYVATVIGVGLVLVRGMPVSNTVLTLFAIGSIHHVGASIIRAVEQGGGASRY